MTEPDYREKAKILSAKVREYEAGLSNRNPDEDITQALHDAHLAGRREGIEASAKVAEKHSKNWETGVGKWASQDIAMQIEALLRGGKDG